ncbi:putative subtilase-type serine protease precursor [Planctomycetes bacterium CA13]|uniref:Putative subtilase-type serine protease n=1 Tax=Novipirellula herctigrandis TaxID=2527986 RepID=A0A5C5ZBZ6_9BACT|nr:putative subtilase-type serine protease precursor [Planctomycetes bacterium CA13]
MSRFKTLSILALAMLLAAASSAQAQNQYIGYVYPAGGQQGTTFPIRFGGQRLTDASGLVVSGEGVSARLIDYQRVMSNQELGLLRQQLNELKKKDSSLGEAMVAEMAYFEFPAIVKPPEVEGLMCPACGRLNPLDATVCIDCNANLDKQEEAKPGGANTTDAPELTEIEVAKQNLIERIERLFAEDQRNAAVRAHTEIVFAEVTVDPDAKPGRREIRVVTKRGISNPMAFYVDQVPEVSRKPMKTCQLPVLGKEHLAQRKRPVDEEEVHISVPCTMNGQIAAGEMNHYRFEASKGQRLVISAKARQLSPYVADGVPGWFQAVLRLHDADGNEIAYNDDFRFSPDPIIYVEIPEDDEYVLTINEALFRGRESFVYRITIGELPFLTSIFPLGGPVGEPVSVEMNGWNLDDVALSPAPLDAKPGIHLVAATNDSLSSNYVPFALDTLPECMDIESNDAPSSPQKVTLPIIVNGRADKPGDWDVFEVDGKAGETIVAEVNARRLGSPFDSFLKVTSADGKIIALNDDHYDAASGMNTDHADSYLMVKLPADGKYFIHLGDTRRHAGKDYAYRLRISKPQPDFVLRVAPSRFVMRSKNSAAVKVYAIRKDGYTGPIKISFKDLPEGLTSGGATIGAGKESVGLSVKTSLTESEEPINVTVVGSATIGEKEVVHRVVPTEDRMQAFLWRHLLPAEELPAIVYDPSYKAPADRIHPPIRDEDRPKDSKRTLQKSSVDWYLRQIEGLYQQWFLTDDFANGQIASIEARLITD